jgi:hypothetical protein
MGIGGVRAALRFTRRRSVRIAAIATAVLVVGGVGVAVAATGGHRDPEAVSDTSVEDSPSPSSEPTSPEAETDSSDSGEDDSGVVSLGGPIDDSSSETDTDDSLSDDTGSDSSDDAGSDSSDDTGTDSSDSTGDQEPAADDSGRPAPLGSVKGVWWSPGDAFTSSRLWVFDGSGHGYLKDFQRTGIDGPFQNPSDFTYESGGSDVRLSVLSRTSVNSHELVLSSLSYDSSGDTLSLSVDGSSATWFGCSSNRQSAVAAALCG